MARFRLRYRSTDLEMPPGDFLIGRSSSCSLAIDDGLVSRRHARLRISEEGVVVEDMGSRNGVQVNGRRISGPTPLQHMDRLTIGNQEMVVLSREARASAQTLQVERCWVCGTLVQPDARSCPKCGSQLSRAASGRATLDALPSMGASPDDSTRTSTTFELLVSIASKALAMGRYAEAQRVLGPGLDRLADSAHRRGEVPKDLETATQLVLQLCEGPDHDRWMRWLFETYAACRLLMPTQVIDQLHEIVRRARYNHPGHLRAYLSVLHGRSDWSVSERFRIKRLEGLERVITA